MYMVQMVALDCIHGVELQISLVVKKRSLVPSCDQPLFSLESYKQKALDSLE